MLPQLLAIGAVACADALRREAVGKAGDRDRNHVDDRIGILPGPLDVGRREQQFQMLAPDLVVLVVLDDELLLEPDLGPALFGALVEPGVLHQEQRIDLLDHDAVDDEFKIVNEVAIDHPEVVEHLLAQFRRRSGGQAVRLIPDHDGARFEGDLVPLHVLDDEGGQFRLLRRPDLDEAVLLTSLMSSTARVQRVLGGRASVDLDATGLVDARVRQSEAESPDPVGSLKWVPPPQDRA